MCVGGGGRGGGGTQSSLTTHPSFLNFFKRKAEWLLVNVHYGIVISVLCTSFILDYVHSCIVIMMLYTLRQCSVWSGSYNRR